MPTRGAKDFEYHVALSFAGEDRAYVDQVAHRLVSGYGLKVFYDLFERVKLLGKDLYEYLSDIYMNKAMFCAVFISEHYAKKAWPRHERKNAQARDFEGEDEYILPFRFDDTAIPGLRPTVGYINIAQLKPEETAAIIAEKVRLVVPYPVMVTVKQSEVFRESGNDFVGVDFECLVEVVGHKDKQVRKLYPLVSVKGDWKRAKSVEIDGVKLEQEDTTMMFRPFTVPAGRPVELCVRSVHDISDRRDLDVGFLLSIQFEIDGEKYKQTFPLQYNYFPF